MTNFNSRPIVKFTPSPAGRERAGERVGGKFSSPQNNGAHQPPLSLTLSPQAGRGDRVSHRSKENRNKPVYIHAAAALGPHGDITRLERRTLSGDPPPLELKERVKEIVGVSLRQASHLVELAAIGSQLCVQRLPTPAPEDTAVYLGTGLAEVRKNEAVFKQVMPPGPGMASPFDFINAANNMAAFYTAKLGNFRARNLTVTQEEFSFEWALKLAYQDLCDGNVDRALAGGVDENSHPRARHLRRMQLRDDQVMGEGAGFLYLSCDTTGARAELLGVERYKPETLIERLHAWRRPNEALVLLPGFRLEAREIQALLAALPNAQVLDYLAWCGCFHTAAAFGLAGLFDQTQPPALYIHINHDAGGRGMSIGVRIPPIRS